MPYSAMYYLQADETAKAHFPTRVSDYEDAPGDMVVARKELSGLSPYLQSLLEKDAGTRRWAVIDVDQDEVKSDLPK
jgi:hypothetical protein